MVVRSRVEFRLRVNIHTPPSLTYLINSTNMAQLPIDIKYPTPYQPIPRLISPYRIPSGLPLFRFLVFS